MHRINEITERVHHNLVKELDMSRSCLLTPEERHFECQISKEVWLDLREIHTVQLFEVFDHKQNLDLLLYTRDKRVVKTMEIQ